MGKRRDITERKRGRCIREGRLWTELGFPADSRGTLPVITVTGAEYVLIENHCGLLHMSDTCVKPFSGIGVIVIRGERLRASEVDEDSMLLHGTFISAGYE